MPAHALGQCKWNFTHFFATFFRRRRNFAVVIVRSRFHQRQNIKAKWGFMMLELLRIQIFAPNDVKEQQKRSMLHIAWTRDDWRRQPKRRESNTKAHSLRLRIAVRLCWVSRLGTTRRRWSIRKMMTANDDLMIPHRAHDSRPIYVSRESLTPARFPQAIVCLCARIPCCFLCPTAVQKSVHVHCERFRFGKETAIAAAGAACIAAPRHTVYIAPLTRTRSATRIRSESLNFYLMKYTYFLFCVFNSFRLFDFLGAVHFHCECVCEAQWQRWQLRLHRGIRANIYVHTYIGERLAFELNEFNSLPRRRSTRKTSKIFGFSRKFLRLTWIFYLWRKTKAAQKAIIRDQSSLPHSNCRYFWTISKWHRKQVAMPFDRRDFSSIFPSARQKYQ